MVDPAELQQKLEKGRAAVVASLRDLAGQLEALPLRDAAEVILWLRNHLDDLERAAALMFRRG